MTQSRIFELRRYRLRPDGFEALLTLFEREFVETQEACGMRVEAIYRDLDDPLAFVWIRSFPDMATRTAALAAFYSGATWTRWGADANATMVNSDNVLLLRPTGERPVFPGAPADPPRGDGPLGESAPGVVTITVASLAPGGAGDFATLFATQAAPLLEAHGARLDATFATDPRPNPFPRLPVREGETVFAWVAAFPDETTRRDGAAMLARNPAWRDTVMPALDRQVWQPLSVSRLRPMGRSRHRW